MHMIFISPTFYKNKIKHVYENTVCPGKPFCVFVVNGNVFCSQHILNKAKLHTQVLFCCLKCHLATTSLVFFNCNAN